VAPVAESPATRPLTETVGVTAAAEPVYVTADGEEAVTVIVSALLNENETAVAVALS
jgi:hypothetical protein